jgi:hypothetical protein
MVWGKDLNFIDWQKANPEKELERREKISIANSGSRNGMVEVICDNCHEVFSKYKSELSRRNFCSRKCFETSPIPDENLAKRSNITHTSRHYAHDFALKIKPHECEICGLTGKLEIHHKDRNFRNNIPKNLLVVCPSCHRRIDGRVRNISRLSGDKGYMNFRNEYEAHRLSNGRFGGWA